MKACRVSYLLDKTCAESVAGNISANNQCYSFQTVFNKMVS